MELTEVIDIYCEVWSRARAVEREKLLASVWADGASYTDPSIHAVGADELLSHIASVLGARPGSRVLRTSGVDFHHRIARFEWKAIDADGALLRNGLDVAFISPASQAIERIVGFFGPLRPLDSTF
jgi:hypothetical protein